LARWRQEERDLLRRGQYDTLVRRFQWLFQIKVAGRLQKVCGSLDDFDDVLAAALERFAELLPKFNLRARNGLNAFVREAIDGAISDGMADQLNRAGIGGLDTRLRRFLRGLRSEGHRHPSLYRHPSLEEIQRRFPKYTPDKISLAMQPPIAEGYTEENELNSAECDPRAAAGAASSQYSRRAALGYRWRKKPKKPRLVRNIFSFEIVRSVRGGLAHGEYGRRVQPWSYRRTRVYGSPWNDNVWWNYEREQLGLPQGMGRQRYADYLVERSKRELTFYQVRNGELAKVYADKGPSFSAGLSATV
jgi:hypothetical protein